MGRGSFSGEGGAKPVKVGDELDIIVEAMAARGDGIAKKEGFVIFIKGAAMGQTVRIRVTEVRERFATAEVVGAAGAPSASAPEPVAPASEAAPESPPEEPPAAGEPAPVE